MSEEDQYVVKVDTTPHTCESDVSDGETDGKTADEKCMYHILVSVLLWTEMSVLHDVIVARTIAQSLVFIPILTARPHFHIHVNSVLEDVDMQAEFIDLTNERLTEIGDMSACKNLKVFPRQSSPSFRRLFRLDGYCQLVIVFLTLPIYMR